MSAYREGDHFVVETQLPGMKLEDIDVSLEQGVLTIRGDMPAEDGIAVGPTVVVEVLSSAPPAKPVVLQVVHVAEHVAEHVAGHGVLRRLAYTKLYACIRA